MISAWLRGEPMKTYSEPIQTCEIIDPITQKPEIEGAYGKAWKIDLEKRRATRSAKDNDVDSTLVHWIIECPLAHPLWHSYSLVLVHLRPVESYETIFHLDGATHELWLNALSPKGDRRKVLDVGAIGSDTCSWLYPGNFAAQIIEIADDLALERIENAVRMICNGELSPDTDFVHQWVKLFGNSMIKEEYR